MKLSRILPTLLLLFAASRLGADDLKITVGAGYEYISTDYYLLREDTLVIDQDSLESLKLTSDASNEFSFLGKLRYSRKIGDLFNLSLYNRASLSNESIRNNLDLRIEAGAFRLVNYMNLRDLDEGDDSTALNRDYLNNSTSASFRPHLGNGLYLDLENTFELTRYDEPSGYYYNYHYNKLSLGLEKNFGFKGRFGVAYRNDAKRVSDSSRLDFDRHVFRLAAEYSPGFNFRILFDNEYSLKDSKKENNVEDNKLENMMLTVYMRPNALVSFRLYSELEYSNYDVEDFVYYDLLYMRNELEFSISLNEYLQAGLTPHYRFYSARNEEFNSQDYKEFSIEPGIEINIGFDFWLDASFEIGKRKYPNQEDGFLTDHNLYVLDLLVDTALNENLRFNLLGSIDWERHDEQSDNTTLYLISTLLEYTF